MCIRKYANIPHRTAEEERRQPCSAVFEQLHPYQRVHSLATFSLRQMVHRVQVLYESATACCLYETLPINRKELCFRSGIFLVT